MRAPGRALLADIGAAKSTGVSTVVRLSKLSHAVVTYGIVYSSSTKPRPSPQDTGRAPSVCRRNMLPGKKMHLGN